MEVTDINDNPPEFLAQQYGPYFILEASPNAFIDNIQAEDPDLGSGGIVTYSLIGEFRGETDILLPLLLYDNKRANKNNHNISIFNAPVSRQALSEGQHMLPLLKMINCP